MATLQLNGSVLIVKYLYDNNGSPYYQRRVPSDLQVRFGRTKLAIGLDPAPQRRPCFGKRLFSQECHTGERSRSLRWGYLSGD
jgi:hypothetical protein